jgi:TolB-like protein/tetratricopeptide (TPR) repeat protein
MQFFEELKRRNVVRVGIAYVVTAWLVLQVAELLASIEVLPGWLPRILFFVLAIGFGAAVILTWLFELTEKGLQREKDARGVAPKITARQFDYVIMGLMALALAYFVVDKFVMPGGSTVERERSIAVLPFKNRSSIADDSFFVDGIHDDILTQLANLSGLEKVISRTSVERFRDTVLSMTDIGRQLDVAHILEGGVQRAGDRVRINMQLIDAATDEHIWAETYDRELTVDNLFAMQSEISREIVVALHGALTDTDEARLDASPTSSMEAYGEYVLGREALRKRTIEHSAQARTHFEKAIELDPEYALAWVGLSDAITTNSFYMGGNAWKEALPERRSTIERALDIDPLLGEAYASLGGLLQDEGRLEEAREAFLKAIDLSPGYAQAYQWYSHVLGQMGQVDEALANLARAIELDPLMPIFKINQIDMLRRKGEFDAAVDLMMQGVRQNPEFTLFYNYIANHHWNHGNVAEAARWFDESIRLSPGRPPIRISRCRIWLDLDDPDEAERCYKKFVADFPDGHWTFRLQLHQIKGEYDQAAALARTMVESESSDSPKMFLAWMQIMLGDLAGARATLESFLPEVFGDEEIDFGAFRHSFEDFNGAMAAVHIMSVGGDRVRAAYLVDGMLALIGGSPIGGFGGSGLLETGVHVAARDAEASIDAFRRAIDAGVRREWWLARQPDSVWLMEYPEYSAMIEELEADAARQREWYEAHKGEPLF